MSLQISINNFFRVQLFFLTVLYFHNKANKNVWRAIIFKTYRSLTFIYFLENKISKILGHFWIVWAFSYLKTILKTIIAKKADCAIHNKSSILLFQSKFNRCIRCHHNPCLMVTLIWESVKEVYRKIEKSVTRILPPGLEL